MSEFPENIVQTILSRFGIDQAKNLQPWPFPDLSTDLLARFEHEEKHYFLKRRRIEQRGERSLFETQFIQKELLRMGIPVPILWESPDGETLLAGPDWEKEQKVYFEIQTEVPGKYLVLNEKTAFQSGKFLGHFHQVSAQIDTFLLNKQYWIKDFTSKRYNGLNRLRENLRQNPLSNPEDAQIVSDMIEQAYNFSQISARSWGLYHGDMNDKNLLTTDDGFFLIDLDEMGIGEIWGDVFSLLCEVPGIHIEIITPLLKGYREGGGTLNADDLLAIINTFTLGRVGRAIKKSDTAFDVSQLLQSLQFIKDL